MADLTRMGLGARRMMDTVLRGVGGRSVLLRVPVADESGNMSGQLGLAVAAFADTELAPVVLRPLGRTVDHAGGARWELLVSAQAAATIAGGTGTADAMALFAGAAGVVVDGVVMRIAEISYRDFSGVPYLYRVELQAPAGAAT